MPPKKRAAPNPTGKGGFKKGQVANPKGAPKQIFGTRDPFKQALMRRFKEYEESDDPRAKALRLDAAASTLIEQAILGKSPVKALELLRDTLDGRPQASDPPPQINTINVMMNNIRALNLTDEQFHALKTKLLDVGGIEGSGVNAKDYSGA